MPKEIYYSHESLGATDVLFLPLELIYTERTPARKISRNQGIRLAQSVKKYGLSTPIEVLPSEILPGQYRYRVLHGEELWMAAATAGLSQVPCILRKESAFEREIRAVFDKIRQKSADFLDQARMFDILKREYGLPQAEIAHRAKLSPSAVANKLRLCRLTPSQIAIIRQNKLTERHARALLRLPTPEKQGFALERIAQAHLTVAESEALVEALLTGNIQTALAVAPETPQKRNVIPLSVPKEQGYRPHKFALHTLRPLYNSLERTLGIFRKTGRTAEMRAEEGEDGILITIKIPSA